MVDVQHVDGGETLAFQHFDGGRIQFIAGFGVDFAGLKIHRVARQELADQGVGAEQQGLQTRVLQLLGLAGANLGAGGSDFLARIRVDQCEVGLHTAPAVRPVLGGPTCRAAGVAPLVAGDVVKGGEDLLPVHAQRIHEGGGRELPPPVDAHINHVLGVELEVEPGAAIRDHPRGEQQLAARVRLAFIMVEEHARRAVHLRDDHPLGAVDDEGALLGHQRDVAHIDVLLLDVLHRAGAGLLVVLEHDQAQLHLQRRGERHVALDALLDVVLGVLELVGDVFQHRALVEILDREDGLEHRLHALVLPAVAPVALQELFVGGALNLDQVRHLHGLRDAAERLTDPLLTGERLRHF